MLLHVVHETRYDYASPVKTAQHQAHLRPRTRAHQTLVRHALRIEPQPAQVIERTDTWGNVASFFHLTVAHPRLRVVADSLVRTAPPPAPAGDMAWDDAREHMRYHRDAQWNPAGEFAFASPYVPRHADFVAYAGPSFTPGRPLQEAARELAARIHADFAYQPRATDVGTPALQALALRQGVCQDFAHVMLGCLRSLGLPARYVSGYLLTEPPPGQPRLVGADASHAWVSVYLPPQRAGEAGTWFDLDPTNDRPAGEDYVTLAIGRDYADVAPLRGVLHGGAQHRLQVAVTVAPADAALLESTAETPPESS